MQPTLILSDTNLGSPRSSMRQDPDESNMLNTIPSWTLYDLRISMLFHWLLRMRPAVITALWEVLQFSNRK
jgi:hypothetical protein